ncbi:hypothetical protein KM427_18135 [Nocardioides sp. LMS-CY]|uniref:hypothetical protein n=1 Tax=Nocardioides sp. (strain LMS-CY) TaxID=2840457 RepID=UPI001C00650C|nr:hypothetical protein [Nocardioides sp. LMS-CY]QWF20865.1 hypothetical protein KM427_18135 [Nocardioides sp. LMS-CY]
MYAALWRLLPGPTWLKVAQALALVALLTWALLAWVFPAVEPHLPFDRITVGD